MGRKDVCGYIRTVRDTWYSGSVAWLWDPTELENVFLAFSIIRKITCEKSGYNGTERFGTSAGEMQTAPTSYSGLQIRADSI